LLFLAAAVLTWSRSPSQDSGRTVGGTIGTVLGLLAVWFTVRAARRLPEAIAAVGHAPALARGSGRASVTLEDSENDAWKVALTGGPAFAVSGKVARAFRTSVPYTVYYVLRKRENVLLAAEPAAGEDRGAGAAHA